MPNSFVNILLPLPFDEPFTYRAKDFALAVGDVVKVPFRKKELWGLVVGLDAILSEKIDEKKVKEILAKNEQIKFSAKLIEFVTWIASYNMAPKGLVLKAFIGILNADKTKNPKFIAKVQEVIAAQFSLKKLSEKQQKVADEISDEINKHQHAVHLIDGVTGSGKTEIYFDIIAKVLQKKTGQILILLPEIALTSQLLSRFEKQFGFAPALWHSKISPKEKREIFYGIIAGSVRVLIGARSSLLLPFNNLQLIVVDEEHDASFKQEDVFNFHARDMAILKGKLENFPVILSSATPALETYSHAISGKYRYFALEEKFNEQNSDIKLIDLRREKLPKDRFISQDLEKALVENFLQEKQSLLFLNRRGYAPVTLCKSCGQKVNCPNCSSYLTLHKNLHKLVCHYCGESERASNDCVLCGAKDSLRNIGAGVEKIKEEIEQLLPQARTALVTSDNVTNFKEADELVKKITNHEIDIIIGTQIIAKGYDFPDLTLVGVVDADSGFYSSELRASERSYQLLKQVIGRAGRHKHQGKVFIQTYNPENFIFEKLIKGDKKNFYDYEMKNRQNLAMPPFTKMAAFVISDFAEKTALGFAKKLVSSFPFNDSVEVFGPAPLPLFKFKNRFHYRVFLKVEKKVNLQKLIADVMKNIDLANSTKVRIDIDP